MNKKHLSDNPYFSLTGASGLGSFLFAMIIIIPSTLLVIWEDLFALDTLQIGILSGSITFAIAAGNLLTGKITVRFGLIRTYNVTCLLFAAGALLGTFAPSYPVLLAGLVISGFMAGLELPVNITVVSQDSPDEASAARNVASTQIFITGGILISYGLAFIVSALNGETGYRIMFAAMTATSLIAAVWRLSSPALKLLHESAKKRQASADSKTDDDIPFIKLILQKNNRHLLVSFIAIMFYYCFWNLMANTFGQFQTYMLVNAGASQTLATGCGILLNVIGLFGGMVFASKAGTNKRALFFYAGIVIEITGLIGIAAGNSFHVLTIIILMLILYNIGGQFAGEAIYKIWTQESFPAGAGASASGYVSGCSRFCCGIFALFTPALVKPEMVTYTMLAFCILLLAACAAGTVQMRNIKKNGSR